MTAATIACHNRGSTPSVANSSLLFHSMRRNQVNEASTMQNVVVSVSLVCRLQRFGGRWLRHERMRLSRTGKPSVPQNALTRIGRPTAQLLIDMQAGAVRGEAGVVVCHDREEQRFPQRVPHIAMIDFVQAGEQRHERDAFDGERGGDDHGEHAP